ncbi:MAG: hypothetical protein Q7S96_04315 [bacterium]|nr:hypothetical protein [bacterium]
MRKSPGGLQGLPKLLHTPIVFVCSMIIFIALLFVFPRTGFIAEGPGSTILTITTFLFGIIAGFYIYITSTDYIHVKNLIATETSGWASLFRSVTLYHPSAAAALAEVIDTYVRRTFDYEIIDYPKHTIAEYDAASAVIQALPFKKEVSSIHQVIMGELDGIALARQQLLVLGAKSLSVFSWAVLFALAGLVVASLYGLRTGALFFDIVTVLIASAVILIFLLIRDLDLYIWNERSFGFEAEASLFCAIGKLPYYPEESIARRRVHPKDPEYRVGIFTDFPRTLVRRIEIRRADGQPVISRTTRARAKRSPH